VNLYGFVLNQPIGKIDLLGLKCDCSGNESKTLDCRWTKAIGGSRVEGADMLTLIPHNLDPIAFPEHARVYWDNICNQGENAAEKSLVSNPSGATNLDLVDANSARTSLQSRYFAPAFALATNPWQLPLADSTARALGAAALPLTKAKFCCCK
jgi:hypothetical protein